MRSKTFLLTAMALTLLVTGTTVAQAQGTISGTVTAKETGEGLAGATVLVIESNRSVTTHTDGSYTITVPPGSYTLLVTKTGHASGRQSVTVAAGATVTANFEVAERLTQFGENVVVVGSRTRRTAIETPVPVDVVAADDLIDTGQTETSRMIQFLAPSFNFSTSTVSDGTDIVRPSTLRGLGPDQTLVLVNGKRRHNSALVHVNGSIGRGTAGVDLNAIPPSAIDRIEVLRDGAAAQYGSDAIAGVINIILKSDSEATRVDMSAGQNFDEDGETYTVGVNRGWSIFGDGFFNISAEFRDRGFTNRAGQDPRRIFNYLEQEFGMPALSDSDGDGTCDGGGSCTLDPREATYNRLNHRYGDAASENAYVWFNSEIPVSDNLDLYFFGGYSDRDGESAGFNRLPSQSRTNVLIHPAGFLPRINTRVNDYSFSAGARTTVGEDWTLDANVTTGMNEFEFIISNSANTSLGTLSPTMADAGTLSFGQTTFTADLYTAVDWGLAKPTAVAVGLEFRKDEYEIEAGQPESYIDGCADDMDAFPCFADQFGGRAPAGIQVFPGFQPANQVDKSRDNIAIYGDIEMNPSEDFLFGVAARFEDYSDFGSKLVGKLTGRYAFTEEFALRGSASTGFRAPSLHQSNFNNISTQFVLIGGVTTPLEVGTFRIGSPVANALGAEPLKEETSVNYGAGFTAKPMPNLLITADVFKIDIDDRIVISGQFRAADSQELADILDPFGVNAAQFFTNAIDTETEGAEIVVAWTRSFGDDQRISLTGAGAWNDTQVVGSVRTPAPLAGLGETLFNRTERTFVERGQPREHYTVSAKYAKGPFTALTRFNKFGAVTTAESPSDPSIDQTFTGKWLTDLDLSYRFNNGVRWTVGASNIFDEFPDKQRDEISFNGIFQYPRRTAPFGFNGGYYYTRLSFVIP